MRTPSKPVLVLYTPRRSTPYLERISGAQARLIRNALAARGLQVSVRIYHPEKLERLLDNVRPRLIFNLAYGYFDRKSGLRESQADVAGKLEAAGVPVIGSSPAVQRLVQDKLACGAKLRELGINAPCEVSRHSAARFALAIRKPRFGACHREVTLLDPQELEWPQFDPETHVVQEYIDGEEFTVAVIEEPQRIRVLPPLRIHFAEAGRLQVLSSKSKAAVLPTIRRRTQLEDVARRVFRCLGMQDYARIDLRVRDATLYVLDVNALPNLDPARSYLPLAAEYAGIPYARLIQLLVSRKLSYSSSGG
jgi:D-alanine-D-alanine ligase